MVFVHIKPHGPSIFLQLAFPLDQIRLGLHQLLPRPLDCIDLFAYQRKSKRQTLERRKMMGGPLFPRHELVRQRRSNFYGLGRKRLDGHNVLAFLGELGESAHVVLTEHVGSRDKAELGTFELVGSLVRRSCVYGRFSKWLNAGERNIIK